MAKLHEVLAVEADLEGKAKVVINEAYKVFKENPGMFMGFCRTYHPFIDDGIPYPEENKALPTTVPDKLNYVAESVIQWFDAIAQKEATNQVAVADIIVDGQVIAEKVPATLLLGLESRLKMLRSIYEVAPTLAHAVEWKNAPSHGTFVWETVHPEEVLKTAKTMKSKVLYEATQHHPAQIEKWDETENVGKYTKRTWSGMISSAQKAKFLERLDLLLRAVKQARQRANNTEVVKIEIGKKLMDFINK